MPDWKSLPAEILVNIFQVPGKRDVGQCALTCHAWNLVAQPILFESILCWTERDVQDLIAILSNNKLKQSPANFVKHLRVYEASDDFDVALLDNLFPFLESFDLHRGQQSLYTRLHELIMKGKFLNLKKMPFVNWDEAHLELLMNRRDSIRDIQLRDKPSSDKVMMELFSNMHLFSKLNKVQLYLSNDETNVYLESLLLQNPPALKTIDFSFMSPTKLILNTPTDLNTIQPLTRVREVKIEGEQLLAMGDESYVYFMNKFPNLQKLTLYSEEYLTLQTDNYKIPSLACLSKFFGYILNIKERFTVYPIVTNQITGEAVEDFLNQILARKRNEKVQLKIAFNTLDSQSIFDDTPIDYTTHIETMSGDCGNKKPLELKVVYKLNTENMPPQPYLKVFQRVGNMNVENLDIGVTWGRPLTATLPIPLDTTLDYFTNLKTLYLHEISNITFINSKNNLASTLESLTFKKCKLYEDIFFKLSARCLMLNSLEIDACHFIKRNAERNEQVNTRIVSIHMPSTHLRELCLSVSSRVEFENQRHYQKIMIRLKADDKKSRYCKIVWNSYPHQTDYYTNSDAGQSGFKEEEFNSYIEDKECMIYDIYCGSVTKFTVKTS